MTRHVLTGHRTTSYGGGINASTRCPETKSIPKRLGFIFAQRPLEHADACARKQSRSILTGAFLRILPTALPQQDFHANVRSRKDGGDFMMDRMTSWSFAGS